MINLSIFKDKKIAVLGLGKSGLAVTKALKLAGADYVAWDDNQDSRSKALEHDLRLEDLNSYSFEDIDYLVLSPGIAHTLPSPNPIVTKAKEANVKVVNDVFLFKEAYKKDIIAITGTNGKSTTTALVNHVLSKHLSAQMGGNIGTALIELDDGRDVTVAELSSYQTEITPNLSAKGIVWLNITPDHIDRHGDIEGYVKAKARIFETDNNSGTAAICIDDDYSKNIYETVKDSNNWKLIPVSTKEVSEDGVCIVNGEIFDKGINIGSMDGATSLRGEHNHQNAACAYAIAHYIYSISNADIISSFQNFGGLPHRQFNVAHIGNVNYINDSKATNAEAAEKALRTYNNIYWLAGGVSKDGGITSLKPYLSEVKKAYLYGECAKEFSTLLKEENIEHEVFVNLDQAFKQCNTDSQAENNSSTVLLSPAGASFDQYSSFEKRGEHFEKLVKESIYSES